jgi:hypothetical protein
MPLAHLFGKKVMGSWGGSNWINSFEVHKIVCKKKKVEECSCGLITFGTRETAVRAD